LRHTHPSESKGTLGCFACEAPPLLIASPRTSGPGQSRPASRSGYWRRACCWPAQTAPTCIPCHSARAGGALAAGPSLRGPRRLDGLQRRARSDVSRRSLEIARHRPRAEFLVVDIMLVDGNTTRCPTPRDFVPWRFSDAGIRACRLASSWPASENLRRKSHSRGEDRTTAAGGQRSFALSHRGGSDRGCRGPGTEAPFAGSHSGGFNSLWPWSIVQISYVRGVGVR
jgi:hypothetical protein